MTLNEISNIRLLSQGVEFTRFKTVKEVVSWMGAMQAQDFEMAKWAIGVRSPGSTDKLVEDSINKGEIIRTHLMRPTWHFVAAEDIYWMLGLTASRLKALLRTRHNALGLSDSILTKSFNLLEKALSNGSFLTREELAEEFKKEKINTDNYKLWHILARAEFEGIVCSGPVKNSKITYALLPERVPDKKVLIRTESVIKLAKRYFTSHCPATLHDFVWWSGLPVTEARHALEEIGPDFSSETIGSEKYWFTNSSRESDFKKTSVHLLPAFDEFLISYKDRTASLLLTDNKKTISNNGIFRPLVIVNGQITGLWNRTIKNNKLIVTIDLFHPMNKTNNKILEKKISMFGQFLRRDVEIRYSKSSI